MSVELREIRRRIAGTRQIRKVTSALQKMAAAQLLNDRRHLDPCRLYVERFRYVLRELFLSIREARHPLMAARDEGAVAVVVFGSDRGLCGGFNTDLAAALHRLVKRHQSLVFLPIVVGRVAQRKIRHFGLDIATAHRQPGRSHRRELLRALAADLNRRMQNGELAEVRLLYTRFVDMLHQAPIFESLLPVRPDSWHLGATALPVAQGADRLRTASLEPGPEALLDTLLPEFVFRSLDHAFLHSLAAEDAARQLAMNRASLNASDMLASLLKTFSRLRQETITTEMIEIAGGSLLSCPQEE